ncbi:MAG: prepilin-type N-terminal cleavage/methylation domain-containing protein [Nitrospirae bacterium]|nr:prepilin-type N-terminal cleavage/methylation domain-containing protein [Nitrospirota bacterium]
MQAGNKGLTPHKYHCAGFTLLELIVVIFIVGISVSIVVVFVGKAHEKAAFRETSKKIYIILKHARELALMEKTTVIFKIDEGGNSFWTERDGAVYGRVQKMPKRVHIKGESIMFFPKGNSSGGRILIEDSKERRYYIEVDPVLGTPKVKGI